MPDLTATVNDSLAACYEKLSCKLHKWVDPLSETQFWRNPFPYGNDIGHLVLHLTGNLNYYIGAQIAQTGYIRDRDKEFSDQQPPGKAAAMGLPVGRRKAPVCADGGGLRRIPLARRPSHRPNYQPRPGTQSLNNTFAMSQNFGPV